MTASHPILFNGEMVRAILSSRKTQTRRLKGCENWQPGDLLWVRETFSGPHCMEASEGCAAAPPSKWGRSSRIWYWADGNPQDGDWTRPRPSIHMPRWASRLTLRITDVRRERLNAISGMDAVREGISPPAHLPHDGADLDYARREFMRLWDSIYCEGAWAGNPLVWVVSFKLADGTA